MAETVLDQLRGGNSLLQELRGAENDAETQQMSTDMARLEQMEQEWVAEMQAGLLPQSATEAFLVSSGARMNELAVGFRDLIGDDVSGEREEIEQLMAPVEEKYPVASTLGTVVTDIAASAPAGLGAGAAVSRLAAGGGRVAAGLSSLPGWAQRGVSGLAMGGAEGAVIGLAEGDPATGTVAGAGLGAAAEIAIPPIMKNVSKLGRIFLGRTADDVVRQVDGQLMPSKDLQDALETVGLTFDDVKGVDLTRLPDDITPDQFARAVLFDRNQVPTLRSRITQDAGDFADEVRISRMTGDEGADMVRQRLSDESGALQNRIRELSEALGVPDQAGDSIRTALQELDTNQREGIRAAYDALTEFAEEGAADAIPLNQSMVREAIDDVLFGTLPVKDETRTAIQRAAAKYGILGQNPVRKGAQTVVDFDGAQIKFNGDPEQLNLGNFEEFRKELNRAFKNDTTGAVSSVKRALDNTVVEATDVLKEVADDRQNIKALAERARQTVITRKELLDTGTLVPRLMNDNPRTGSPFTEASQVTKKIFTQSTPAEEVDRLVGALRKSGEKGQEAIQNLQADTVLRLMDKAFKNAGKLDGGQTPFNVTAFTNELRAIGPAKLEAIFGPNSPAVGALKEFQAMGQLMRTPDSAVQKGSAPDMVNALIRAGRNTGILTGDIASAAAASAAGTAMSSANKRAIRRRIIDMTNLNEEEAITFMTQNYPALALALGLTAIGVKEVTDNDE